MLDQFMSMLKAAGGQEVFNQSQGLEGVPQDALMQLAGESIFAGLQSQVAEGGLNNVLALAQNTDLNAVNNHGLNQNITQHFAGNLTEKFGLNGNAAKALAAAVIPLLLSKLFSSAKSQQNSGIDLGGIFDALTGGKASSNSGFGSVLSKIAGNGLDADGDGDVDMQDIIAHMYGFAKKSQASNSTSGGGIMDALGGLLGKLGK
jgi:hypothetical protein